jgi:polyhydroxyalkanoate synthesis regulator phasin
VLTRHRKTIVAGAAALAVVAGGGAAIGATGALSPEKESQAVVEDAAEELGVEPSELTAALKNALKSRVDAAVAAGRLTQAEGQAMKERIDAGEVPLFGLGPGLHDHGPHFMHAGLEAAAEYLGMTEANLRSALEDGKTLAQVARSEGKTVNGLVDAMVADAKAELADAVKAGRITQAESQRIQADLEERITDLVNGEGPRFHFRDGPRPGMVPPPTEPSSLDAVA